jgi:aldose 1-epimerase
VIERSREVENVNSVDPGDRLHTAPAPVSIAAGGLVAEIVGGPLLTIASLRYQGVEMLVDPTDLPPRYRVHGTRAGITLLHPWANRLGADAYAFRGVEANLGPADPAAATGVTRDANGLAIHGVIGSCSWRPQPDGVSACHASLTWFGEPAFPFAHQVLVRLAVVSDAAALTMALRVSTTITALSSVPVPVAFGWHPYFRCDRQAGCELQLPARSMLESDARGLPTGTCTPCAAARIGLVDESLDEGVLLLGPEMVLRQASPHGRGHAIAVAFEQGYPYAQLFAPRDAPVVSLEPMTAPTDALRRGSGLAVTATDRPYTAAFAVRVGPLS